VEEEAVFSLFQLTAPRHELRSAFTRGSIRGWVYLETTMNEHMNRLLKLTPGIVRHQTGIICEQIKFQDWTKMMMMCDHETDVNVGSWVRVRKGTYKGDIGYVVALEPWGVRLLLVPRLPPPRLTGSALKRKCSTPTPEPTLFDPVTIERIYGTPAIEYDDGTYQFNGRIFEEGLIVIELDLHSVSLASVSMPTAHFFLFQQSRHPTLLSAKFPRPSEWSFDEGERVRVSSSGKLGVVKTVTTDTAEIDLADGEGVTSVTWTNLRKYIVINDFVEIVSGPLREQTGWVEGTDGETVHVVELISAEKLKDNAQDYHIKVAFAQYVLLES
jgi:transcription antitermination factor NusG